MLKDLPVLKMEFLVTRRCNLRCDYCKIVREPKLWGEEMTTEQAKSCIDLMADNWPGAPVIIYGGEPTLRDDLPELIAHAVKRDVKHAVISNSRKIGDDDYIKELMDAGLSNWSISYDGDQYEQVAGGDAFKKSFSGLRMLRKMRDKYGVRDLVACITVTCMNIDDLPRMVSFLTEEGIWSICTPLQLGGEGYDYSQGKEAQLPSQAQLDQVSPILEAMAESGKFLMHNGPEWFAVWPKMFRDQTWRCRDKSVLTVDADGSLRYCVDIPLPEPIFAWELRDEKKLKRYRELLSQPTPCQGCFWDPCFEGEYRATHGEEYGIEKGRETFRHELTPERIAQLTPKAQRWFKRT